MRAKQKSRIKKLDQIIIVQVLLLIILIGVLVIKKKESVSEAGKSDVTPTPTVEQTVPTNEVTILPTIEPTTVVQPDNLPEEEPKETDNELATTEEPTIEPSPTPEEPSTKTEDETGNDDDSVQTSTNQNVPSFAKGLSQDFINSLANTKEGTLLETTGIQSIVYYMQTDSRWAKLSYGETDTIEKYGCAPTSLAMVISTLTDIKMDPVQMCAWSYEKGYWFPQQGSLHNLVPDAAQEFGLKVTGVENTSEAADQLRNALKENKLVIALMGKGNFTKSGHFIVLRGITDEDMVYVADPNSQENTDIEWKLTQIINEAKSWAGANGPFWIISK